MVREIDRLRPDKYEADEYSLDADDSWLAELRDDQGPEALAHLRTLKHESSRHDPAPVSRAVATARATDKDAGANALESGQTTPRVLWPAAVEDGDAHEEEESEEESDEEDESEDTVSESQEEGRVHDSLDDDDEQLDEDELLLSPVSRYKLKLQKMKWKWYEDKKRREDARGFTALDRRLRLLIC